MISDFCVSPIEFALVEIFFISINMFDGYFCFSLALSIRQVIVSGKIVPEIILCLHFTKLFLTMCESIEDTV